MCLVFVSKGGKMNEDIKDEVRQIIWSIKERADNLYDELELNCEAEMIIYFFKDIRQSVNEFFSLEVVKDDAF